MMPGSKGLNPHELAHKWMKDLGTRPQHLTYRISMNVTPCMDCFEYPVFMFLTRPVFSLQCHHTYCAKKRMLRKFKAFLKLFQTI